MAEEQNEPIDLTFIDKKALLIFQGLVDLLIKNCGISVREILNLSKEFMNDQTSDAVKELYLTIEADQKDGQGPKKLTMAKLKKSVDDILSVDKTMKTRISPVLGGLQFEDSMRQRLSHLREAWLEIGDIRNKCTSPEAEYVKLAEKLSQLCASSQETKDFYECVLKEAPPESRESPNIVIEF